MLYGIVPSPVGSSDPLVEEASLSSMKGILRESLRLLAPRFSEAEFLAGEKEEEVGGKCIEEVAEGRGINDGEEVEEKGGKGGMGEEG